MKTAQYYIPTPVAEMEQTLERMPIRSSTLARQMVKKALPVPETREDIEQYVQSLFAS